MNTLLSGIRVLDITNNVAGPITAAMMADHGAEVIKIERPVIGDDNRFFPPLFGEGVSKCHCIVNRNKKSVVLNLKDPEAITIVLKMVKDADVLIESSRPGVMDRLGLGYEAVKAVRPDIIYCSISAFGHTGPYAQKAGYDIIAQAFSGMMYYTGEPDGSPTKVGCAVGDNVGSINAFGSIMAALYHREKTGIGQYVDISLARGLFTMAASFDYQVTGIHEVRTGNHGSYLCPYGVFRGPNDSSIVIGAVNANLWKNLCAAMSREDLADDPKYCTNDVRVAHSAEVIQIIEDWLASLPSIDEAAELLDKYGVPNCQVFRNEDLAHNPHIVECGWIESLPTPDSIKNLNAITSVWGFADFSELELVKSCAPDLGQHNHEILSQYGLSSEEIDSLEAKWASAYRAK